MNAIDMLVAQHREAERLLFKLERTAASEVEVRQGLLVRLADVLAIHGAIEERHFYPETRAARSEEAASEALEEHASFRQHLADLLETDPADPGFEANLRLLREEIEHHVQEEESELFPAAEKLLDDAQLEELALEMDATARALRGGEPEAGGPETVSVPPSGE